MRKKLYFLSVLTLITSAAFALTTPPFQPLAADSAKAKKVKPAKTEKQEPAPKPKAEKAPKAKPAAKEKQAKTASSPKAKAAPAAAKSGSGTKSASKYQLPYKTWALTLHGGITDPHTDLNYRRSFGVSTPKNEHQWYLGLSAIHMWDPAFGIMGSFHAGMLQGVVDSNMSSRDDYNAIKSSIAPGGNYFQTNFYEGSLSVYWNITNTVFGVNRLLRAQASGREMRGRWVSLYTHLGIGYTYANVKVRDLKTGAIDNRPIFSNGGQHSFMIPVGAGLKFKLSKSIDLGIEGAFHIMMSDKLDGFKFRYPYRRNEDFYTQLGLNLTWKIGSRKRDKEHIEWKHPEEGLYEQMARIDKRVDKLYRDSDNDGVSDVFDKEENTPEGVKVYGDGSTVDSDRDGIPDTKDLEPFSDPGAKVNEFGQSLDSDGDGVPDSRDLEDGTKPGATVNFQGKDLDKKFATVTDGHGGFFFPSVYFNFNDDNVLRTYEDELQSIAKTMRENQGLKLRVIGYCDHKGPDPLNDDLGMRRAKKVIDYMVRVYGFPQAQFEAVSKGKRELEKGHDQINRRVDFAVIK